jgi:hypothetical protein
MKFRTTLLAVALSFGILPAQESPLSPPQSEIIALERQSDGVDLFFTGDPNGLYAVYVSDDGDYWDYLTMGAHLEGDIFHVHDEGAQTAKSRLYRIALLNQDCRQVDPWLSQELFRYVRYTEFLTDAERAALMSAASRYQAAINDNLQAERDLKQAQAELAAALMVVSEARIAWIESRHQTDLALKAKKDAQKKLADQKKKLEEQKAGRDRAEKRRDQELYEKGVFLKWARKFDDEGDTRKADEMRANAEAAQERFEEWHEEIGKQEDAMQATGSDIADTEAEIGDRDDDLDDKKRQESEAKENYDKKKDEAKPAKDGVEKAKADVKKAEEDKAKAAKAWSDAARDAHRKGQKEKECRDREAHAASEAGQSGEPAPKPVSNKPSDRAIQIAKFLQHIKDNGGLDAYNEALRSMFGTALTAGTVTLEGLGNAMAQWASGKAATGAGVGTALASGVVSFGYGLIAAWVQDAAGGAVRGLATRTIVGLVFIEAPNPGDSKFSPGRGRQSGAAELFLHNHDGTVTVFVFRPSQGLTVKNYRLKKDLGK